MFGDFSDLLLQMISFYLAILFLLIIEIIS